MKIKFQTGLLNRATRADEAKKIIQGLYGYWEKALNESFGKLYDQESKKWNNHFLSDVMIVANNALKDNALLKSDLTPVSSPTEKGLSWFKDFLFGKEAELNIENMEFPSHEILSDLNLYIRNRHKNYISEIEKYKNTKREDVITLAPSVQMYLYFEKIIQTFNVITEDTITANAKKIIIINAIPILFEYIQNDEYFSSEIISPYYVANIQNADSRDKLGVEMDNNIQIIKDKAKKISDKLKEKIIKMINFEAETRAIIENIEKASIYKPLDAFLDEKGIYLKIYTKGIFFKGEGTEAKNFKKGFKSLSALNQSLFEDIYKYLLKSLPDTLENFNGWIDVSFIKHGFFRSLSRFEGSDWIKSGDHPPVIRDKLAKLFDIQKIILETQFYLMVLNFVFSKINIMAKYGGTLLMLSAQGFMNPLLNIGFLILEYQSSNLLDLVAEIKFEPAFSSSRLQKNWNSDIEELIHKIMEFIKRLNNTAFSIQNFKKMLDNASSADNTAYMIKSIIQAFSVLGANKDFQKEFENNLKKIISFGNDKKADEKQQTLMMETFNPFREDDDLLTLPNKNQEIIYFNKLIKKLDNLPNKNKKDFKKIIEKILKDYNQLSSDLDEAQINLIKETCHSAVFLSSENIFYLAYCFSKISGGDNFLIEFFPKIINDIVLNFKDRYFSMISLQWPDQHNFLMLEGLTREGWMRTPSRAENPLGAEGTQVLWQFTIVEFDDDIYFLLNTKAWPEWYAYMRNDNTGRVSSYKYDSDVEVNFKKASNDEQALWKFTYAPCEKGSVNFKLSTKAWPEWFIYVQADVLGWVCGYKGDPGKQGEFSIAPFPIKANAPVSTP